MEKLPRRVGRAGVLPRYAQQYPCLPHLDEQRRTAVAEKRQRDARAGDEIRTYRNIQHDLQREHRCDAAAGKEAEAVGALQGDPVPAHDEYGEKKKDRRGADEPQLLAHDGENKVVVFLGKIEVFLAAHAETETGQPARADRIERLDDLPAVAGEIGEGVAEGRHARRDIRHEQHRRDRADEQHTGRADEPVQPYPAEKEHGSSDGKDDDRCGKVRLKHEQRRNDRQYRRERRDAVPEGAHPVFIFAYQRRKVKNNCDFCNF